MLRFCFIYTIIPKKIKINPNRQISRLFQVHPCFLIGNPSKCTPFILILAEIAKNARYSMNTGRFFLRKE